MLSYLVPSGMSTPKGCMSCRSQTKSVRAAVWRQSRESRTTIFTCGIAGTPDCSHLSSWGFLPDHGPKVVFITNFMGLCEGPDSEGNRVWDEGL